MSTVPGVTDRPRSDRRRLTVASVVLGIGLGGLWDGIVLHQILQWHHLISTPTPPDTLDRLELNTLADGAFHAAAWFVTVVGVLLLASSEGARHAPGGPRRLLGGMTLGWGAFNTVEGVVDHHILGLHHVRPGPDELLWDGAFLAWGIAMAVVGWWLVRGVRVG